MVQTFSGWTKKVLDMGERAKFSSEICIWLCVKLFELNKSKYFGRVQIYFGSIKGQKISEILYFLTNFYSCLLAFPLHKKMQTVLCFCLSQPHQRVQQGK